MLKLEKSGRSSQITVRLREQDPFLNSFLAKAFLIALFIHVALFLIFHIQPFFLESHFLYPPVQVQSEGLNSSSLALLDDESVDDLHAIPPPPLAALFDLLPLTMDPHLTTPWNDAELWKQPFAALENRLMAYQAPELSIPLTYSPIRVFISGDLAERPLLNLETAIGLSQRLKYEPRMDEKQPFRAGLPEPLFASYRVQLDEESGMIFWYESQRSTGNPKMDAVAEELLYNFKFQTGSSRFGSQPTHGTIDFVLTR
ncbi:MAG: hypothetical protein ACHQUC_07150 [Chlamydiales bacterium]